jgi:hypothetical protein
MTRRLIALLVIFSVITFHHIAFAQSFFSSQGFGERIDYVNAQTVGLGGANVALPDAFQINSLNPATLVNITLSRLSGSFINQNIWSKSDAGTGFSKYSNFNGLSLALPLKKNVLVVSGGLTPFSQFDYSFSTQGSIDDYNYEKFIEAEGGLNKIHAGFGLSPLKKVSLGVYFNYYFGKLTKKWRVDYVSDLFWDTSDNIVRKVWGSSFSFGLNVNPIQQLHLGAFFTPEYELTFRDQMEFGTLKGTYFYKVSDFELQEQKMTMPQIWGIGASFVAKNKIRLVTGYVSEPWSQFSVDEIVANKMQDRYRISLGVELLPSDNMLAKYHEKMTYRVGYFYQQLNYSNENGAAIDEFGISLGLGLPYYEGKGRLDVAFQYGKRGSLSANNVEETIFQVYITVIAGEKWFMRRRQK